jgi:RNA polymerase sigma-70 factor (ECF subfamily)
VTDSTNPTQEPDERTRRFVRLLTTLQRPLYLYIRTLMSNPADVDEVYQQTNMVMWEKFDQFEEGTNFKAWAFRISRFEVYNHRSRRNKGGVRYSDALLEHLSQEAEELSYFADARAHALDDCLERLPDRDRDLIRRRFGVGADGQTVAAQLGRPIRWVYKAVARIRKSLVDCVDRKMTHEELT